MEYGISFLEGIPALFTPMLIFPFLIWMLGGEIRDYKASLRTSSGCALGFGAVFLAAGAGLTVPVSLAGAAVSLLGLLRLCRREGKLPGNILFGASLALYWTAVRGFFPEKLTGQGIGLLLSFTLGMAVPILFTGVLMDWLKSRRPNRKDILNTLSGVGLLAVGIFMILTR